MSKQDMIDESVKWLRTYCRFEADIEYDTFINAVHQSDGEYVHIGGEDAHGGIHDEVWYHVKVATGVEFDSPPKYFSCSC